MIDKELMQQALEALTAYDGTNGASQRKRVLAALRERLAQPEMNQWQGLTDDVVFELADTNLYQGGKNFGVLAFAKAIEQALKEKNT